MSKQKMIFRIMAGLLFPVLAQAQTMLTADDAVRIGLQKNYDVRVAAADLAIDSVQNTAGAAGMLPNLSLNGSYTYTHNDRLHQKYSNGSDIVSGNSQSSNFSANAALSWVLFDGTKMFVTREKLRQIQAQGEYAFKAQVQSTTADILDAYYDVVRQKQLLSAIDEVIAYNNERVTISEARFNSGLGPKTDYLQAKIDLNVQKESRLTQEEALVAAKRSLNDLIGRDTITTFDVSDSVPLNPIANRAELDQKMYSSNPDLLAFKLQMDISQLTIREARASYLPRLTALGGYNFGQTQNSAGFSLLNQSNGWQAGLTLSVPIFQGGYAKRSTSIAKINYGTAQVAYSQATLSAALQLHDALSRYDSRQKAYAIELESESMARENIHIAIERLRVGKGTTIEVKEAERTLSEVLTRMANIRYETKAAELKVKQQAADL